MKPHLTAFLPATPWRTSNRTQTVTHKTPHRQPLHHARPRAAAPPSTPPTPPPTLIIPYKHMKAAITGLTASTLGSLVGAGGGIVLTPLLTASGLPQHTAHGTSLCVVAATALVSSVRYGAGAAIDPTAAVALAASALVTAAAGARASARTDAVALRRCFGAFLVAVSCAIPVLPRLVAGGVLLGGVVRVAVLVCVGGVAGFLSGLLGIGGGTVNVPALVLVAGFPQAVAQGTAMMAMVVPCVRGAFAHVGLGQVEVGLLPGLLVGAVAGGVLGASAALWLPETGLRVVCAGLFGGMGVRYLLPQRVRS